MTRSRAPFECSLVVHAVSQAALLCSETGEGRQVWIPRSEIALTDPMELKLLRYEDLPQRARGTIVLTMTIPEWLAYDRGLM